MRFEQTLRMGVLGILIGAAVLLWNSVPIPCAEPLRYSLGQFDGRFGLTRAEFLSELLKAESSFEALLGKNLFLYDETVPFSINLIFDERQMRTLEKQALTQARSETEETQANLSATHAALEKKYHQTLASYTDDLTSFQSRLDRYNEKVSYWNVRGGAPEDEYKKLQKEERSLRTLQKELEKRRLAVNQLVNDLNKTSKTAIERVEAFNAQVGEFQKTYGTTSEEFEEGEYTGTAINIYEFEDLAHLRIVLAHELGHALGMNHVENSASLLYPKMGAQPTAALMLSNEDRAELDRVCHRTAWDIIWERIPLLWGQTVLN